MSSTAIRSDRRMRATALVTVSSARWRRTSTPRSSRANQATLRPASTQSWPSASRKNVLPVPDGPHTTRFSRRRTHSRVRRADWVGAGIDDAAGSHASKVLPVGKVAAARRVARLDRSRPASSSPSRVREHLGGFPALGPGGGQHLGGGPADVRQAQTAQQGFEVFGQRGRFGGSHLSVPGVLASRAAHWWQSSARAWAHSASTGQRLPANSTSNSTRPSVSPCARAVGDSTDVGLGDGTARTSTSASRPSASSRMALASGPAEAGQAGGHRRRRRRSSRGHSRRPRPSRPRQACRARPCRCRCQCR